MEKFYRNKIKRLEESGKTFPAELPENDEFSSIEKKLEVIFPKEFKAYYLQNKNTGGYKFLELSRFYPEDDYSARNPETYKSVIVAENGLGDALGLILEKESDFQLKPVFYEFRHETGEVEIFKRLHSYK